MHAPALFRLRGKMLAIVAELDAELGETPTMSEEPDVTTTGRITPARMSVPRYAAARGYDASSVRRWCEAGMPHLGDGRARRIYVLDADAWIKAGGPKAAAARAGEAASQKKRRLDL